MLHRIHAKGGPGKPLMASLIVVVAVAFGAVILWQTENDASRERLRNRFERETSDISHDVRQRIEDQARVLYTLRGVYARNVEVVRDMFELYTEVPIATLPGARAIVFAPRVPLGWKNDFVSYATYQGYFNYKITPEGERDMYFPVQHQSIVRQETSWIGRDIYAIGPVRHAVDNAIRMDTLTAAFLPSRDEERLLAFVIPVYMKTNLRDTSSTPDGVMCMVIDEARFFSQYGADAVRPGIAADFYIGSSATKSTLLTRSEGRKGSLFREEIIPVGGTNLLVVYYDNGKFGNQREEGKAETILFAGFILALFAGSAAFAVMQYRRLHKRMYGAVSDIPSAAPQVEKAIVR